MRTVERGSERGSNHYVKKIGVNEIRRKKQSLSKFKKSSSITPLTQSANMSKFGEGLSKKEVADVQERLK